VSSFPLGGVIFGQCARELADRLQFGLDRLQEEVQRARLANCTHCWRVRTRLPERFGQPCRVLVTGRMNSVLVEFVDGFRVVTSRHYVRRVAGRKEQAV
jgi:hypothetical protein